MSKTSKDNPHKPGTDEWKNWEQDVIFQDRFSATIQDERYLAAKDAADKRIKTATDQMRLQEEKGFWVDEILEFLDGEEPEYDEILDGPVKIVDEVSDDCWKSVVNTNADPLSWRPIVDQQAWYASWLKPVFKGNHVLPKNLPSNISDEQLYSIIIDVSMYEYPEEIYRRGWIAVPIKRPISMYVQSVLDPTDLNYSVAEFYIRRK